MLFALHGDTSVIKFNYEKESAAAYFSVFTFSCVSVFGNNRGLDKALLLKGGSF